VRRIDPCFAERVQDSPWPRAGMLASDLTDQGLGLEWDLVSTRRRLMRLGGEGGKAANLVVSDPVVDALSCEPQTFGDPVTFQPSWITAKTA
jgi:hypothetical protein